MTLPEIIEAVGVEPYYREDAGVIYNADCLDILPKMPEKCVDLVVTDPPYGIGLEYGEYKDTKENWYNLIGQFIPIAKNKSKMVIMPCCQIKELGYFYTNHPPDWIIAWYKGSPGHRAFVGFNDWEPHLVYGKNDGVQMHDYFQTPLNIIGCNHPCPKPIKWANWLISRASQQNNIVCDAFLGSGTTAVAAKQLGRQYIGIEIEKKYCDIAVQRLAQEMLL